MIEKVFTRGRAYARLSHWPDPLGWALTDIFVPWNDQGKGIGRDLMREVLEWADSQNVDVCLSIAPSGGKMDHEALEAWYRRVGFEWDSHILRRKAHALSNKQVSS